MTKSFAKQQAEHLQSLCKEVIEMLDQVKPRLFTLDIVNMHINQTQILLTLLKLEKVFKEKNIEIHTNEETTI